MHEFRWKAALSPLTSPTPDGVETKSVTLVEDGIARFPDAPTARGARHVMELGRLAETGQDASVVFVVQRTDACAFGLHPTADPYFTSALHAAVSSGVRVVACRCEVSLRGIAIAKEIPVRLY